MSFIRAYLRASTEGQDASRAKGQLDAFAKERGLRIASYYIENESGASLQRPELFRLLRDCEPHDVLLTENVDRLSRLTKGDWEKLRADIKQRQVRVVSLDLPTSWSLLKAIGDGDEFTERMLQAINDMMLDMLAAIARKDYDDRRRRQTQGIAKAKLEKRLLGRIEDVGRNADIVARFKRGESWTAIQKATGASRSTLSRLKPRIADGFYFTVPKDKADAAIKDALERGNFVNPDVTIHQQGDTVKVVIVDQVSDDDSS